MKSVQRVNNTPVSGSIFCCCCCFSAWKAATLSEQQFKRACHREISAAAGQSAARDKRTISTFSLQVSSKLAICIGRVSHRTSCVQHRVLHKEAIADPRTEKTNAANKALPTHCVGPGWMLMVSGGPFCSCPPCCTAHACGSVWPRRRRIRRHRDEPTGCAERPAAAGRFFCVGGGGAESAEMDRGEEGRGEERTRERSVALLSWQLEGVHGGDDHCNPLKTTSVV